MLNKTHAKASWELCPPKKVFGIVFWCQGVGHWRDGRDIPHLFHCYSSVVDKLDFCTSYVQQNLLPTAISQKEFLAVVICRHCCIIAVFIVHFTTTNSVNHSRYKPSINRTTYSRKRCWHLAQTYTDFSLILVHIKLLLKWVTSCPNLSCSWSNPSHPDAYSSFLIEVGATHSWVL